MRPLSTSCGVLVLLTAVLVNGCSSDAARVPPSEPAALQLEQVRNVAVTIRNANQLADGTSFTILEPIEFALEFDELRIVLVRHPQTVAEKVDELESPQKFQTVIWSRGVDLSRNSATSPAPPAAE